MEETNLDNLNEKSKWGGKRDGAGRPEGSRNEATLERERVFKEVQNRIMRKAQRILDSQLSLAEGQQFLYRIDIEIDSKGKKTRSKPILVTDPEEISSYLDGAEGDGESMNTETEYYYITTKEPNNQAIDSMFDRTFDKARQRTDITSGGEKILVMPQQLIEKNATNTSPSTNSN